MGNGKVVSIHIATTASGPMVGVREVRVIAEKGLEGDRYFKREGTFSKKHGADREVTLIELEAVEGLKRDYGVELNPGDSRRNIVTRGVALNHLIGADFKIGEVTLRGIRLCEPCLHLEKLTVRGVLSGLVHRGGLRAQILTDGVIRVQDTVGPISRKDAKRTKES